MIQSCRSCGASPPSNSSHISFICEYCGTKNVDDQYFIERAKNIDASKANRYFGLGLVAFKSGDYQQAEKQFEQAVQEDDHNLDGWIYLAHTKAKTLKPSNFTKNILVAINCIKKAEEIDANAEIVQFGSAAIANSFLSEAIKAAQYYFDTAQKKLVAYGHEGAAGIASELQMGFSLIKDAFSLNPNDTKLIASSSIYALSQTFRFDDLGISNPQIKNDRSYFFDTFYYLYSKHKDVALEMLAQSPKFESKITALLDKKDKSLSAPVKKVERDDSRVHVDSSSGNRNKILIAAGGVAAVGLIIFLATGGKNEAQKVPISKTPAPTVIATPAPPVTVAPSAVSETVQQPTSSDSISCVDINSCVLLSLQDAGRGDYDGVRAAATIIEGFPKPDLGNRPVSRKLNTQGLEYFKQENYQEAIKLFKDAMNENPKDV